MSYQAEGLTETLGSAVGLDRRRVRVDLERFEELIESRGAESGASRGEVSAGRLSRGDDSVRLRRINSCAVTGSLPKAPERGNRPASTATAVCPRHRALRNAQPTTPRVGLDQ